jgi:hypothetical protein
VSVADSRGRRGSVPYPPFALPGQATFDSPAEPEPLASSNHSRVAEVLPPIEHFLDEMPSIQSFVAVESEPGPEGWLMDEWEGYDLSPVAALATHGGDREIADKEWSSTQWENESRDETFERHSPSTAGRQAGLLPPTANEVADALYGIAHRIRSGELLVDTLEGMAPEAAMAAALAVVLRLRR